MHICAADYDMHADMHFENSLTSSQSWLGIKAGLVRYLAPCNKILHRPAYSCLIHHVDADQPTDMDYLCRNVFTILSLTFQLMSL